MSTRAELLGANVFDMEMFSKGAISDKTLFAPADKSILEVVQEAGIDVLSACSQRTCGTCETAVIEGTIDHRDSVLTSDERAAQATLMICVSRTVGRRLVLRL